MISLKEIISFFISFSLSFFKQKHRGPNVLFFSWIFFVVVVVCLFCFVLFCFWFVCFFVVVVCLFVCLFFLFCFLLVFFALYCCIEQRSTW